MPKIYEAIRDRFIDEGMGEKEAKMRAAKIYNAKHPDNPVTRKHKRSGKDIEKAIRKNKKRGY